MRDRIVGSRASGRPLVRMMYANGGGSSRSLRKAFAASGLALCGTIRSASSITNTDLRAIDGRRDAWSRMFSTAAT